MNQLENLDKQSAVNILLSRGVSFERAHEVFSNEQLGALGISGEDFMNESLKIPPTGKSWTLSKIGLSIVYILGTIVIIVVHWAYLFGLALESSGGFINPGPRGPYEYKALELLHLELLHIVEIPELLLGWVLLFGMFIYPYCLYRGKRKCANLFWIIIWSVAFVFGYVLKITPDIARSLL